MPASGAGMATKGREKIGKKKRELFSPNFLFALEEKK